MKYIFFKENKYSPQTITDSEIFALRDLKKGKDKSFQHGGAIYYFYEIAFIGEKCHNELCSRPKYMAHPLDEICEQTITSACADCGKPLKETDREYAVYKFGRPVCAAHSGDKYWELIAKSKATV